MFRVTTSDNNIVTLDRNRPVLKSSLLFEEAQEFEEAGQDIPLRFYNVSKEELELCLAYMERMQHSFEWTVYGSIVLTADRLRVKDDILYNIVRGTRAYRQVDGKCFWEQEGVSPRVQAMFYEQWSYIFSCPPYKFGKNYSKDVALALFFKTLYPVNFETHEDFDVWFPRCTNFEKVSDAICPFWDKIPPMDLMYKFVYMASKAKKLSMKYFRLFPALLCLKTPNIHLHIHHLEDLLLFELWLAHSPESNFKIKLTFPNRSEHVARLYSYQRVGSLEIEGMKDVYPKNIIPSINTFPTLDSEILELTSFTDDTNEVLVRASWKTLRLVIGEHVYLTDTLLDALRPYCVMMTVINEPENTRGFNVEKINDYLWRVDKP